MEESISDRIAAVFESAKELDAKRNLTLEESKVMAKLNRLTIEWLEQQKN